MSTPCLGQPKTPSVTSRTATGRAGPCRHPAAPGRGLLARGKRRRRSDRERPANPPSAGRTRRRGGLARLRALGLAPRRPDRRAAGQHGWEFVVLLLACLRAGIIPVMALPAHRRAELSYLAAHAEASRDRGAGPAAPTSTTRRWRESWNPRSTARARGTSWWPGTPSTPRAWTCARSAVRRRACADRARLDATRAGQPGRGGVPAIRRYHRAAEAHPAHPRRLRLQRAGKRASRRRGRQHPLPGHPAGRAQLPAGLPRHPRHAARRR